MPLESSLKSVILILALSLVFGENTNELPLGKAQVISEGGTETLNLSHSESPTTKSTIEKDAASYVNKETSSTSQTVTELNKLVSPAPHSQFDLKKPGAVKRGLIVFSGFTLLAIAYLACYRIRVKRNNSNTPHTSSESSQFRYGVLHSDDKRDNLELSQVPLTVDSEDDEEDLEIFDLKQKNKSLSYVNLHTSEDNINEVLGNVETVEINRDAILLDIEDRSSDSLVEWTRNDPENSIL